MDINELLETLTIEELKELQEAIKLRTGQEKDGHYTFMDLLASPLFATDMFIGLRNALIWGSYLLDEKEKRVFMYGDLRKIGKDSFLKLHSSGKEGWKQFEELRIAFLQSVQ